MKNTIRILFGVALVCTICAWCVVSNQESKILRVRRTTPAESERRPIEVKGVTYFVAEDTYDMYKGGEYAFIFGVVAMFLLIAAAKQVKS